jgi:7-cyano-7-deazaguanine reductase
MNSEKLSQSPLGKKSEYVSSYDPAQLCPIPRVKSWEKYGYDSSPYFGVDVWNAYEISWLNSNGLPQVAIGEFIVPLGSPNLIESKSFKLYLNSLNQTKIENPEGLLEILETDLTGCAGDSVKAKLHSIKNKQDLLSEPEGKCLDDMDIKIDIYNRDASILRVENSPVHGEQLYSHLLKTNCPVTGQPDWGSIFIEYSGKQIEQTSLLKYIVSYRGECDFHEQCVENIFLDIMKTCQPDELSVYARYLRRGGLDINPYRSTNKQIPDNIRLIRQ